MSHDPRWKKRVTPTQPTPEEQVDDLQHYMEACSRLKAERDALLTQQSQERAELKGMRSLCGDASKRIKELESVAPGVISSSGRKLEDAGEGNDPASGAAYLQAELDRAVERETKQDKAWLDAEKFDRQFGLNLPGDSALAVLLGECEQRLAASPGKGAEGEARCSKCGMLEVCDDSDCPNRDPEAALNTEEPADG